MKILKTLGVTIVISSVFGASASASEEAASSLCQRYDASSKKLDFTRNQLTNRIHNTDQKAYYAQHDFIPAFHESEKQGKTLFRGMKQDVTTFVKDATGILEEMQQIVNEVEDAELKQEGQKIIKDQKMTLQWCQSKAIMGLRSEGCRSKGGSAGQSMVLRTFIAKREAFFRVIEGWSERVEALKNSQPQPQQD